MSGAMRRGGGFHPYGKPLKGYFCSIFFKTTKLIYIILGLMQKEIVRSSKLRKFGILVENLREKSLHNSFGS